MTSARTRTALAVLVLLVAGCEASTPVADLPDGPAATPCGGSHAWPPNRYAPAPVGLSAEPVSGTTVRIRNDTGQAWVARVAAWADLGCVGYVSTTEDPLHDLAPHTAFETTVADPGWGEPIRIGVELWDHPCDDACTDPPTGFAFVDPVASSWTP